MAAEDGFVIGDPWTTRNLQKIPWPTTKTL